MNDAQSIRSAQEKPFEKGDFFDFDRFLQSAVGVSLVLVVLRVFFTFLFAFVLAQKWNVRWILDGWVPIIAFNAEATTFARMNAWSLLATAGVLFLVFLSYSMRKERYTPHKAWALYAGVVMAGLQYMVLLFLQDQIHFGVEGGLFWSFGLLVLGASGILYIRKRFFK